MPMLMLTLRDDQYRYEIEVPDTAPIRLNHQGRDWVGVPCPIVPGETLWLTDEFLLAAAADGDYGLRLASEVPLVLAAATMAAQS